MLFLRFFVGRVSPFSARGPVRVRRPDTGVMLFMSRCARRRATSLLTHTHISAHIHVLQTVCAVNADEQLFRFAGGGRAPPYVDDAGAWLRPCIAERTWPGAPASGGRILSRVSPHSPRAAIAHSHAFRV